MNFLSILEHLTREGVEFVIVGGVAARLHGSHRLTHDLDLVPRLDESSWASLIDAICELELRPRVPESRERIQDIENVKRWITEKNMIALSFRSDSGETEIDLLVGESASFERLKSNAVPISLERSTFYVASIDDLIEMKTRAGRPQDLLDIETLTRLKSLTS